MSSCEIARALNITQKTAWFLDHRIRSSFGVAAPDQFTGHCEADETFIGQKARNMHGDVRERKITGKGGKDKTAVMGILERGKDGDHSKVRATAVPTRRKAHVQSQVRKHVQAGCALYSDALKSYEGLTEFEHGVTHPRAALRLPTTRDESGRFAPEVAGEHRGWLFKLLNAQGFRIRCFRRIDHAEKYVDGQIHTNGLENFWSLLKRGLHGTDISVEPLHLFRYLDEQVYRFNNRGLTEMQS